MPFRIIVENAAGDRVETALTLLQDVLGCAGKQRATNLVEAGQETNDEQFYARIALNFLNDIQQELYDQAGLRFGHVTWEENIFSGTRWHTVPTGFMAMRSDPTIQEGQLGELTPQELDYEDPGGSDEGQPRKYVYDAGRIGLYPTPDDTYFTNKVVEYGGTVYVCILRHTATALNRPDLAGGALYWSAATGDYAAHATMTTVADWTVGVEYVTPSLFTRYQMGLPKMTDQDHIPTLPNWFYPAMKAGACWLLRDELEFDAHDIQSKFAQYSMLKAARIVGRRIHRNNPRQKTTAGNRL